MKKLFIILFLIFSLPFGLENASFAANDSKDSKSEEVKKEDSDKKADTTKEEKKEVPGEYNCPYYTVHLPPDWKAIRAPEESQGVVNAIFAKNPSSPIVTMIVGPRQGAEGDLIASMFADQFKASKNPTQKNGQYFFSFPQTIPGVQTPVPAYACISVDGDYFMLTTYTGNQKDAQNFIKNALSSKEYPDLIPKY